MPEFDQNQHVNQLTTLIESYNQNILKRLRIQNKKFNIRKWRSLLTPLKLALLSRFCQSIQDLVSHSSYFFLSFPPSLAPGVTLWENDFSI